MAKKTKSKAKTKTIPFDPAETLDTPEALAEYLTAEAGQTALEAAGKFYAPLPDGGNPLHDIIGAAHYAASKIGF